MFISNYHIFKLLLCSFHHIDVISTVNFLAYLKVQKLDFRTVCSTRITKQDA